MPLVYRTVGQQLAQSADSYGDREAIVSCGQQKRLTYRQLIEQADRLAAGYRKLGLQRGDRIGIWSPNSVEWYVTMMAAARAGLVSVALNPAYQPPEIAYGLKKVGIKAIFAVDAHRNQRYYEMLRGLMPELGANALGRPLACEEFSDLTTVVIDSAEKFP